MTKVTITLDLTKIDKTRIVERTYVNKEGETITCKDYRLDVVPLLAEQIKVLKSGDTWELVKSHFVTNSSNDEERANNTKMKSIGEGISFRDLQPQESTNTHDGVDEPFF